MIDSALLDMIVCPNCLGKLEYRETSGGFACLQDRLFFPIREGIPVLLVDEARPLESG